MMKKPYTQLQILGRLLLLLTLVINSSLLFATDYFISANGNDSNKGTSEKTPWKSINKINETQLKPGDRILFHCGDEFFGELKISVSGTEKKPIVFSSYGSGNKPTLTGAVKIHRWEKYRDNIYMAPSQQKVYSLYKDRKRQVCARYPNAGFLYVDIQNCPHSEFTDWDLDQPNGYWNGAMIRYRTCDWLTRHGEVVSFKDNRIDLKETEYLNGSTSDQIIPGSGYYFDNKFEELDSMGEWYNDTEKGVIYFCNENNPNLVDNIEGAVLKTGVDISKGVSSVEISNLEIIGFDQYGILCRGENERIHIIGNEIRNIQNTAVDLGFASKKCLVKDNQIFNIQGRGIYALESVDAFIVSNKVKNIGLDIGYGFSGLNGMIGIACVNNEEIKKEGDHVSTGNIIDNNWVENTGYHGIRMDGFNNIAENNIVKNALQVLNDGGGIYCWANKNGYYTANNIIRNNIIDNTKGSAVGYHGHSRLLASGIYLDNRTDSILVENNIVCRSRRGSGIFINADSRDHIIRDNVVYDASAGLTINAYNFPDLTSGNIVMNNLFFSTERNQYCIFLKNFNCPTDSMAVFIRNKYYSFSENYQLREVTTAKNDGAIVDKFYCLKNWQASRNLDMESEYKQFVFPYDLEKRFTYLGSKIFYNDTNETMNIELDQHYRFFNLDTEPVGEEINLEPYKAQILLYR